MCLLFNACVQKFRDRYEEDEGERWRWKLFETYAKKRARPAEIRRRHTYTQKLLNPYNLCKITVVLKKYNMICILMIRTARRDR